MLSLKLLATGKALPAGIVESTALDRRLSKEPGYVFARSGVRVRHHADTAVSQSRLAARALIDALSRARLTPPDIDLLIAASAVPEQALPFTACRIAGAAGLPEGVASFDINSSCLSFMTALHVAASLLHSGAHRRIAIVSSELASRGIDWNDEETSLMFGDGAAAVIVERGDGASGVVLHRHQTFPIGADYCEIRAGGTRITPDTGSTRQDSLFRMDGKRVFRLAASVMEPFLATLFDGSGLSLRDIDVLVPHQASHLGMQHMIRRIPLRPDAEVVDIFAEHGNQVAASLPTALHEADQRGLLTPGRHVLMLGTAAGFSIGGLVLRT